MIIVKNILMKLSFFSVTFLFLFLVGTNVKANSLDAINIKDNFVEVVTPAEITCESLLGDPNNCDGKCPAYWLQWILDVMKYIAIVALLVLVIADFLKALVQDDKDALKKAGKTAFKRFVYCVLLFFVPIVVEIVMKWFGVYGNCLG